MAEQHQRFLDVGWRRRREQWRILQRFRRRRASLLIRKHLLQRQHVWRRRQFVQRRRLFELWRRRMWQRMTTWNSQLSNSKFPITSGVGLSYRPKWRREVLSGASEVDCLE